MLKRYSGIALALLLAGCQQPSSHQAQTQTMTLPGNGQTETTQTHYQCADGQALDVTYHNNEPNMLAVVKSGNQPAIVMANVIAGSGAKYTGNVYQWWTKGQTGTFSNLMENKQTECKAP